MQLIPVLLEAAQCADEQLRGAALAAVQALGAPLGRHPEMLLLPLVRAASDASKHVRLSAIVVSRPAAKTLITRHAKILTRVARCIQVSTAASSALEAVLGHAEPEQCLPLLQHAMQVEQQQPDRPGEAKSLQVKLQPSIQQHTSAAVRRPQCCA